MQKTLYNIILIVYLHYQDKYNTKQQYYISF